MGEPRYVELDLNVEPCAGCGRITANPWQLCTTCTSEEANDKDWHRSSSHTDPWGVK